MIVVEIDNIVEPSEAPRLLKASQLLKACRQNSFLRLRSYSGQLIGINTRVAEIAIIRGSYHAENETEFVSYKPCSFQEYITYKIPLIGFE